MAGWGAIHNQGQIQELLSFAGLSLASFSPEEWQTIPLNQLEIDSSLLNPHIFGLKRANLASHQSVVSQSELVALALTVVANSYEVN